eukprot:jgi/Hompol1/3397/HPOL_003221-RA
MRDEKVKECYDCKLTFTAFRRKHHCRICGRLSSLRSFPAADQSKPNGLLTFRFSLFRPDLLSKVRICNRVGSSLWPLGRNVKQPRYLLSLYFFKVFVPVITILTDTEIHLKAGLQLLSNNHERLPARWFPTIRSCYSVNWIKLKLACNLFGPSPSDAALVPAAATAPTAPTAAIRPWPFRSSHILPRNCTRVYRAWYSCK